MGPYYQISHESFFPKFIWILPKHVLYVSLHERLYVGKQIKNTVGQISPIGYVSTVPFTLFTQCKPGLKYLHHRRYDQE